MQQRVCTSMYLTLELILFIENYYFPRLKCSQNCVNKFNSPIFKMVQNLGCHNSTPHKMNLVPRFGRCLLKQLWVRFS
jgi:hypothetical protein